MRRALLGIKAAAVGVLLAAAGVAGGAFVRRDVWFNHGLKVAEIAAATWLLGVRAMCSFVPQS